MASVLDSESSGPGSGTDRGVLSCSFVSFSFRRGRLIEEGSLDFRNIGTSGSLIPNWHSFSLCLDIDECAANTHDCAAEATCTNNEGSFICTCLDGFQGNGNTCKGKNTYIVRKRCNNCCLHIRIHSANMSKHSLKGRSDVKWPSHDKLQLTTEVDVFGKDTMTF